jgi:hypothetical protein
MEFGPETVWAPGEIHHLLLGSVRAGHLYTICLCYHHHRKNHQPTLGPSLSGGSKEFHARYGSDQELLDYQNDLICSPRTTIQRTRKPARKLSKVVPRAGLV